jgi:hypothetical protein
MVQRRAFPEPLVVAEPIQGGSDVLHVGAPGRRCGNVGKTVSEGNRSSARDEIGGMTLSAFSCSTGVEELAQAVEAYGLEHPIAAEPVFRVDTDQRLRSQ